MAVMAIGYVVADNMEKFNGQNDSWKIAVDRFSVSETQGREHKSTAVLEESKTNRGWYIFTGQGIHKPGPSPSPYYWLVKWT